MQQNLDFLPGFWSNFGGAFNYAYTVVDGKGPTGAKVSLPGISKHNFNVIGYYETDLFGVRLTYNYRTDYDVPDAAIFGFGGAARRVMARRPVGRLGLVQPAQGDPASPSAPSTSPTQSAKNTRASRRWRVVETMTAAPSASPSASKF
ncbi:hypothetical protein ACRAWD_13735 [Caulobacter segnis]